MRLTINGVDMTPYIAYGGVKWQRNDVDGPDAGRGMDGTMHRLRVSKKVRMDITCRPLKAEEISIVLNAIDPEYVTVQYDDPKDGYVTKTMYANNNPATFHTRKRNGTELWSGVTFPLIEQ